MSQIYQSAADFEALYMHLFDRIADDDPDGMDPLVEQQMVIHFELHQPDAELWVDGRTKPVQASFGPQPLEASFTARLSGDTLHTLLLGTLPLGRALLYRKLKVDGSKTAALKLESLLHACQAVYPGLADEMLGHNG